MEMLHFRPKSAGTFLVQREKFREWPPCESLKATPKTGPNLGLKIETVRFRQRSAGTFPVQFYTIPN